MGGTLRRHSKGRYRLVLVGQRAAGSDVEIDLLENDPPALVDAWLGVINAVCIRA